MKKVVVFGGGTGLSCLLSGLRLFPVEVTTVIAVSDNGSSTGVLRKEFDIPAVGDVGKVLLAMADVPEDVVRLLDYRFRNEGSTLHNHPVRNILLTALIDQKGSLTEAARFMSRLLNIKGEVLPLTEERVDLVGLSAGGGAAFFGEESVSQNARYIATLSYDHDIHVSNAVKHAIGESDLIIFSPGSLYTSILPHLIVDDIVEAIRAARAPIMYVANLVTQPGETDGFDISHHLAVLNRYLRARCVDIVIGNDARIDPKVVARYLERENKTLVRIDAENIDTRRTRIIADDIFSIDAAGRIRHNALKTAFLIFSYLMEKP